MLAAEVRAQVEDTLNVDAGMLDVEIGHIQMFVVLPDQGECCWYLEWKIKGEPEQNEHIYRYQVNCYDLKFLE